ncbi:MAG: putative transporter substrate binding protein [Ilumatobacteraceae bacterium]|nr:putative transporter substrate binding protein [Ilumatobacteraceae bacterium]
MVALLAVAGLGVAACGSDKKDSSPATTVAATAAPAATTAASTAETTAASTAETTAASTAETTGSSTAETTAASTATSDSTATSGSTAASDLGEDANTVCDATKAPATLTKVKLQLQWFTQAQFAGYYAAVQDGCYAEQGLDVQILEGGTDIVPQTVLASGQADFAIAWVPKALASIEAGADIEDIAQVYQRSGTLQVSFKDKDITTGADFKGKKIGNWGFGNEYEIFADLAKNNLKVSDVTLLAQQFDMSGLLSGDIDAAEAMVYNEYAQVLETMNPATGKLYTPDDLNVVSYEKEGVGMLQDAIWADAKKLASDATYKDTAVKFVTASLKGWAICRDDPKGCRDIVVAKGSKLGAVHQLWQMNEVNKLIWPADGGVGHIDPAAWDRTVKIALGTPNADGATVITKQPGATAYTNDIVDAALKELKTEGVDTTGDGFTPLTVTLTEGGS